MPTAFVLSGGGSLGAVHVGMLRALHERGVAPDFFVAASAGALNATFLSGTGVSASALDRLDAIWCGLRRQDVFPFSPHRQLLALAGARPSLCSADGLRRIVDAHLAHDRLEDAQIPVHLVATDVLSGKEVTLSTGDARAAVLASAAVPGVFPTVSVNGRVLFDGGVADNTPISQALALGADRIVVLPAGTPCALTQPPRSAVATAVHALTLLIQQRLALDVAALDAQVQLVVLPPLCPLRIPSTEFRAARRLIDRAYKASGAWLQSGNHHLSHPERFMTLHTHPDTTPQHAAPPVR